MNDARRERKDGIDDGLYSEVESGVVIFDARLENLKGRALRVCEAARVRMAVRWGVFLESVSIFFEGELLVQ